MKKGQPKILVFTNNHFDPTWRRCWDRRFVSNGVTYASYAELQDFYMQDNLELSRRIPGYKFEAECSLVLEKFLERHPEKFTELKKLSDEGRFAVSGAGYNIIDSNMVCGESIVRNFLYGLLWVEDTLGVKTILGTRKDAFGNSAQIPQIFRGCEIKWATDFNYSHPVGEYFRGIDGSAVCCAALPTAGMPVNGSKCAPCEKCHGEGCSQCNGRGIHEVRCIPPEKLNIGKAVKAACVTLCPEELLPCKEIGGWIDRMSGKYDISFAIGADALEFLKAKVDAVDKPPKNLLNPGVELNPNNTGCYVTRIKLKQECRRLEGLTLSAESLCSAACLSGNPYPAGKLAGVWRKLLFTMFHDAVTATHIDAAYDELMDINRDIDHELNTLSRNAISKIVEPKGGQLSVINPRPSKFTGIAEFSIDAEFADKVALSDEKGRSVHVISSEKIVQGRANIRFLTGDIPGFSSKRFIVGKGSTIPSIKKRTKPVIENFRFRIIADEDGIKSIYDKKLKRIISAESAYRPGEPIIESDEGSPWATLKDSTQRMRAKTYKLEKVETGPGYQRMVFELEFGWGTFAGGSPFVAKSSVTLYDSVDRVEFDVDVSSWEAFNARIRFAFPVPFKGDDCYEVPYAVLKRKPYKPFFSWIGASGDWPAINWAGIQSKAASVAIFNKGTPSYKIESDGKGGKIILLSVLRSPLIPTYLHEPSNYVMTDFWGMRDAGKHRFEFALASYGSAFDESSVVDDAESYNVVPICVEGLAEMPEMPELEAGCARISSVKMSEKGNALIVRLVETSGCGGNAVLHVPSSAKKVLKVNLLERNGEELELDAARSVRLDLRPWEISTIRCELD